MAKIERTSVWKRRRDKGQGGYAFVRRHEKSLARRGLAVVEKLVGCFPLAERGSDGKFQINFYRDIRVRLPKRSRRPDDFVLERDLDSH